MVVLGHLVNFSHELCVPASYWRNGGVVGMTLKVIIATIAVIHGVVIFRTRLRHLLIHYMRIEWRTIGRSQPNENTAEKLAVGKVKNNSNHYVGFPYEALYCLFLFWSNTNIFLERQVKWVPFISGSWHQMFQLFSLKIRIPNFNYLLNIETKNFK